MVIKVYRRGELSASRPLAGFWLHAAFESPGTDYEEDRISLDNYVSKYPAAVYYVKVVGDCMEYSGIESEDLLVVDKSLTPQNGDVIVGVLNDQYILACYVEFEGKMYLMPDNPKYQPHQINEYDRFTIEGVIPHSILNQRRQNSVRVNRLQQLLRIVRARISA
ncbi:LexA family transcriptional regulator [Mucilaginibacter pallidiroseus]|uniref:LexA family transcriptional regulator n=1 Tax=Mucilaginibacter pallidiroseus TaxID=2599295 RepID=A0A563U209_9SPHI|nr:S24 family peptidase [Mucilaginibacter pallidiroseus]TWR25252.1 LexA family transcriptional regulator [Mucilaginibacter pallidiroseus]